LWAKKEPINVHRAANNIITNTKIINAKISDACAHDFLLGCVPSPKAQTNNITNPTKGIAWMRKVISQSPIFIGL
jgi:hypothetical protein